MLVLSQIIVKVVLFLVLHIQLQCELATRRLLLVLQSNLTTTSELEQVGQDNNCSGCLPSQEEVQVNVMYAQLECGVRED